MASEPIECQVVVLRVSIHCEGCKKKVKKVLQNINGVYRCDIDARSNKVVVTASSKLDPYLLVAKLRRSGKQAELWPEQPVQQQQPAESQEPKNDNDEPSKPNESSEKQPGSDGAEDGAAAEPSNAQHPPEPKQSGGGGETPKPSQEASNANGNTGDEAAAALASAQQRPNEAAKGKPVQMPELEKQPVAARVTVEYDRGVVGGGGYVNRMPVPQHPVHVMSYNVARPSPSASYYAAPPAPAPAPVPAPMPRQAGPPYGYIDEQYTPSYYARSSPAYEPYHYPPQPSPYSYPYQPALPSEDYYYSAPPQRSAFSPPRGGYGDMFNDENANSCSVM